MTSLPDALRLVPGVQVARISANTFAITSRGFNGRFANKLLVLIDGRSILEVGAATGLATFELVSRGARRVKAVEPDRRLAVLLRAKALAARAPIGVVETAFEDATLERHDRLCRRREAF